MKKLSFMIVLGALAAHAQTTYILTAVSWGATQDRAVSAAGGTVRLKHQATGIAIVESSAPDFLARALVGNTFQTGAADVIIQWQPPEQFVEIAAITPGDETFINLQWNVKAIEAPGAWAAGFDGQGVRVAI